MAPTVSDHGRRKSRSQAYDDTPPMFEALCDANRATRFILRKALLEPQEIRKEHAELHRLREDRHRIAQALQHPFPQGSLPESSRFCVRTAYRPAASVAGAGGGWYDVFRLPDGRTGFSFGDVARHGVQAAVRTVQVRAVIRALAFEGHAPFFVLGKTSQFLGLISDTQAMGTAVFGVLDPHSGTAAYANAGPTQPILATSDGRAEMLPSGGPLLSVRTQTLPPTRTVRLSKGALLVFYSGGCVAGEMNLLHAVRAEVAAPSRDPAQAILNRALGGGPHLDGIALLTIMASPEAGSRS